MICAIHALSLMIWQQKKIDMNLTSEKIKEIFDYDSETGQLFWKVKPGLRARVNVGDVTGSLNRHGYLQSQVCGRSYKTHRLIFTWCHGRWPTDQIDHINGVKTDNRISNLREVTPSENLKNQKLRKNNKSGCIGVSWNKRDRKWVSQIKADGKRIYLGLFIHLNDAIQARKAAEIKYGYHKNHGSVLEAS